MKKSRFFLDDNFNATIIIAANRNIAPIQDQIITLNGKNNFSNDENFRPGGIANISDP